MRPRYTARRLVALLAFLLVTMALMVWFVVSNLRRAGRDDSRPDTPPRDRIMAPSPPAEEPSSEGLHPAIPD